MKILVIGANGFLGGYVVDVFKRANHDVYASARSSANERIECDLSSPSQLLQLLESVSPDVIVNCAAVVDFGTDCLGVQYSVNMGRRHC